MKRITPSNSFYLSHFFIEKVHLTCPISILKPIFIGSPLIFLILKIPNIAHGSTILGGLLQFLILKTPNIAHQPTILGGPLIFLIFVSKPN